MKKKVWKQMKLFTMAGVMSLTLLGCGSGGTKEEKPVQEEQNEVPQEMPEKPEPEEETPEEQPEQMDEDKGLEAQNGEQPIGEILDLGDGQFTIRTFYQEAGEDGSDILVSPADGSEHESEMESDSLTVLCDENTRIYKRTIRDGGASYEDSESSFEQLEKGMEVSLKGSYEKDAYRAKEVQIVDVVL